ncbi:DUF1553 domain-containing protein [Allorhodopirellula heiligendammensis]|uniref:DUF1549 domain-containing protein n=1 Tax=Allorhodopirellula heiligendammensis TaxID=2714739 RepID=A0A5C6BIN6_9BACT|nr:DUF1553 domain-containing protein [Allorhodopirellula heiligendammensis]TWU11059.1 hypothetical protein Poly21_49660 [Allorhodopirellula heiligendammensis]
MRSLAVLLLVVLSGVLGSSRLAQADSRGEDLAAWLDQRGQELFGPLPTRCDDLTFARRVYLDVLGRVPSVSELRDFEALGDRRRHTLIDQLVFGEGTRAEVYQRLAAANLARQWRRVLLPPGTTVNGAPETLELWLQDAFARKVPFDEMMRRLTSADTSGYYQLLGSLPENYAAHISRVALGVRMECAQCHDHPFVDWKQSDFWGLAAFYGDMPRVGDVANASRQAKTPGSIWYEGTEYAAKFLWDPAAIEKPERAARTRFAAWLTSAANPNFSATAVNRFWQLLVGRGLFPDVENLDLAMPDEREVLDEFGQRFAATGFSVDQLTAAICKSAWYQAESAASEVAPTSQRFTRTLKVISPEQVFDSLEQSLILPVSRIDPASSRWSGDRLQLVSRLSETTGTTPEDYAAGIPQALMLMNGKMTSDAISSERSRLLRAVLDSPFFNQQDRIKTLYLAVLTREPSAAELSSLSDYLETQSTETAREHAYGEILWALLNSPEFVLCR